MEGRFFWGFFACLRVLSGLFFERGGEGCGELFVEGEEEFEAVAVGGEGLRAIGAVDGEVEIGVGFGEGGGHGEGVVEVGEGRTGRF